MIIQGSALNCRQMFAAILGRELLALFLSALVLLCAQVRSEPYFENIAFRSPVKELASKKYFLRQPSLDKRDLLVVDLEALSFAHGVASGDPESSSVVLWTKLSVSEKLTGNVAVGLRVLELSSVGLEHVPTPELFSSPDSLASLFESNSTQFVLEGTLLTNYRVDYTVKLIASGLKANARYLYQFRAGNARSLIGHTKTLPLPNDTNYSKLRLATFSCSNYPFGFFSAYRLAAQRELDVVLHLGDYIYEYANGRYGDGTSIGRVHSPDRDVVTLQDYRQRYAQYKSDEDLQTLHQRYPWITVWDDHEFADDSYPDGAINHDIFTQGSWTVRKANAVQAYYEYLPIRQFDLFDQYALKPRIFRSFSFGQLASLHMLDTRMFGREITDLLSPSKVKKTNRSMLGAEQEQWLHRELEDSKRNGKRWRLLGNQVIFSHFEPAFRFAPDRDSWDNYPETRSRLLKHIDSQNIDNVVFLTGDIHSSWVHEVAYEPWNSSLYNRETGEGALAVEFVGPSVTSPGPGDVQPRWRFIVHALEYLFMRNEPHLKFVELYKHGYMYMELGVDSLVNQYWYVTGIKSKSCQEFLGASFRVDSGYSHVERLQ